MRAKVMLVSKMQAENRPVVFWEDISDNTEVELVIRDYAIVGEILPINPNEPWPIKEGDQVIIILGQAELNFEVRSDMSLELIE